MQTLRILAPFALVAGLVSLGTASQAAYANYNSVLLGARAAGLGGAFTALGDDPAATPFYNPATTVLSHGSHLSSTVNVYNKFDTSLGQSGDFTQAPQRLNRGYFRSLPAASATILGFPSFAFGLSILVPDYDSFSGQVKGTGDTVAFMTRVDESLWVGGTLSVRLTPDDTAGVSMYYTARNLSRTVNDRRFSTGAATITNEEKNLSANSMVPIFGVHRRLSEAWSVGVSYRPPSLPISGEGTYYRSITETTPYTNTVINRGSLRAITKIPSRLAIGFARETPGRNTLSVDLQFYEGLSYHDLPDLEAGTDQVEYRSIMNFAVGYEQVVSEWLRARFGIYSNASSHPDPKLEKGLRQGDHVDMNGFSANFTAATGHGTSFTFGGYYSGGEGMTTQLVGGQLALVSKQQQVFTMLIAGGYEF